MFIFNWREAGFVDRLCQRSMSERIPLIGDTLANQGDGLAYYRAKGEWNSASTWSNYSSLYGT